MRTLVTLLFLLLLSLPARANSRFVEINVDATAENAAVAREKAMGRANRQAVLNAASAFTGAEGMLLLKQLNNEQLLNFITETTVLEEKSSNVRYIARLKVAVDTPLLKQYLQEKNVPISAVGIPDMLVLPVFRQTSEAAPQLWENSNPWRMAWINYEKDNGFGKIRLMPENTDISAEKAMAGEILTDATSGKVIYTADALFDNGELNIRLTNTGTGTGKNFSFRADTPEEAFNAAIAQISEYMLREQSQNQITAASGQQQSIAVLSAYGSLSQWLQTENNIRNLTPVDNVNILAVGNGRIQFQIDFTGGMENLQRALRQISLKLEQSGNYYILSNITEIQNELQ